MVARRESSGPRSTDYQRHGGTYQTRTSSAIPWADVLALPCGYEDANRSGRGLAATAHSRLPFVAAHTDRHRHSPRLAAHDDDQAYQPRDQSWNHQELLLNDPHEQLLKSIVHPPSARNITQMCHRLFWLGSTKGNTSVAAVCPRNVRGASRGRGASHPYDRAEEAHVGCLSVTGGRFAPKSTHRTARLPAARSQPRRCRLQWRRHTAR
jgi:hypothetical protein